MPIRMNPLAAIVRGFRADPHTASVLLIGALALLAILVKSLGIQPAIALWASLIIAGSFPGGLMTRRLWPRGSLLHHAVIGTILGLAFFAVGGMLSHVTGQFWVRWLPSVLVTVLALSVRPPAAFTSQAYAFPRLGLTGAAVAVVGLLPALQTVVRTQPTHWTGWFSFYPDLPFHVALTSEVAARAPEVYPWASDTALSYPWMFHSAMGVWASLTNSSAADVVMQAWPALFVFLLPAALSLGAWEISKNRFVALITPLFYVFTTAIFPGNAMFSQIPFAQLSPTRDFADLLIILIVVILIRLMGSQSPARAGWWITALAVSTFVVTGAKGSAMPVLIGGLASGILALICLKRFRRNHLAIIIAFVLPAALSYGLTLPSAGSTQGLALGPFTFLGIGTPHRLALSVAILALIVIAIAATFFVVGRSPDGGWVVASVLTGVVVAGATGLSALTHAGFSQNYFWQNSLPVLAIAVSWSAVILYRKFGWQFIAVAALVGVAANTLSALGVRLQVTILGSLILALTGGVSLAMHDWRRPGRPRTSRAKRIAGALICAGILTQACVSISFPTADAGGAASVSTDESAVSSDQLAAFRYIRDHSQPTDEIITNKHCLSGSGNTCDARWFALSTWTERRVLVEGWSYTPHGATNDFVRSTLEDTTHFINHPSQAASAAFARQGVLFVYVDKREPYSRQLSHHAKISWESPYAVVYALSR